MRHYRQQWASFGHHPQDALVGAGTAGFHVASTSQQALADYRLAKLQKALQGSGAQFVMLPSAMTPDDWIATPGRHIDQTWTRRSGQPV